jgi:hypothetical protein
MPHGAEQFYRKLGWRQDVTPPGSGVYQFTPHGSACSVQFGKGLTTAEPGSGPENVLDRLRHRGNSKRSCRCGIDVSETFHLGPNGP